MNKKKGNIEIRSDTYENWEKAVNFIVPKFTIIVYESSTDGPRIKIGDGKTLVNDLPFLNDYANPPRVKNDILTL